MNITLFGGAFDPPHLGHLIVATQAFELIPHIDQLWFMPSRKHPFAKTMAPLSHRLNMLTALIAQLPSTLQERTHITKIEQDKRLSGKTIDTIRMLQKLNPTYQFNFLMGADQLLTFESWHQYQQLLQQIPFYIFPRSNVEIHKTLPNMHLLSSDTQAICNISSTLIKQRMLTNLPIQHLMPLAIHDYIQNNAVYQRMLELTKLELKNQQLRSNT